MTQLTRYKFQLGKLIHFSPQLVQEIKTRIKLKSTLAILVVAIAYQFSLVVLALGKLPDLSNPQYPTLDNQEQFSRYCTGAITYFQPPQQKLLCLPDLNDHWLINWQLFWVDIFTIVSVSSILLLIIGGTYLIVTNLSKEQAQGTLALVNLAPQPASQFFIGKILGIPVLLYGFVALCLPLHLIAGLLAGIKLSLMIAFYLAILASCTFFYSLSLFFVYEPASSNKLKVSGNRSILITVAIACFLLLTASLNNSSNQYWGNINDWFLLFNPLNLVLYLAQITAIPTHYFNYESFNFFSTIFAAPGSATIDSTQKIGLANISIYGHSLQHVIGLGIGLVITNFLLGASWFWQAIKRRFNNCEQSSISKEQSYWLSLQVGILALGLTLTSNDPKTLVTNFGWLNCFLIIFALVLISSLSPNYYALSDWLHNRQSDIYSRKNSAKYSPTYSLWQDLIFGESSPANLAIALNLIIINCYIAPAQIIFSIDTQAFSVPSRLILQLSLIVLVATLWQWLHLQYPPNRFQSRSLLLLSVVIPVAIATSFNLLPATIVTGIIPLIMSVTAQWLATIILTGKTIKTLKANSENIHNKQLT